MLAISVLEPLQAQSKEVIICVVNDSVAFSTKESCFYSLDSADRTNWHSATEMVEIMKALRSPYAVINTVHSQGNAYDCGVYTLAHAEIIASLLSVQTAEGKRVEILSVLKLSTLEADMELHEALKFTASRLEKKILEIVLQEHTRFLRLKSFYILLPLLGI